MSNSNQYGRASTLVIATAFLLIILGWFGGLVSSQWIAVHDANAAYQQNSGKDRQKSADEIAQACRDLSFFKSRQCVRDNLESHYQDQAANKDLQAQQDMAFWAMWLLIISVFGIGVSAVGVAFLIMTIRQGKAGLSKAGDAVMAANAANQIMRDEQRPWISITDVKIVDIQRPGLALAMPKDIAWFNCILDFKIRNSGSSPALKAIAVPEVIDSLPRNGFDIIGAQTPYQAVEILKRTGFDGFPILAIPPNGCIDVRVRAQLRLQSEDKVKPDLIRIFLFVLYDDIASGQVIRRCTWSQYSLQGKREGSIDGHLLFGVSDPTDVKANELVHESGHIE